MRAGWIPSFLIVLVFVSGLTADEKLPQYPVSHRIEQVDTYNGVKVADPYRWLEETDSAQVTQWVKAQEQLFASYVDGFNDRQRIRTRLASLWHFDFFSTPIKANNTYFFTKTPEGQITTSLYKQALDRKPEPVFNPETLGPDMNLSGFQPSPDGRSIVCMISKGQSRWREARVVSDRGQLTPDSLKGLHTLSGPIAWSRDSSGFYYIAFEQPEEAKESQALVQNPKIYYHRLGTKQSEDPLIHSSGSSDANFMVQTTEDGRYLVITAREGGSAKNKILYTDLSSNESVSKELVSGDAAYTYLGNTKSEFYFYTDLDAPNGRIISVNLERSDKKNWKILIPESRETIAAGSLVGGNAVGYYGNRFVILYWKDAMPVLKSFDQRGKLQHRSELPEGSSIWGGISGNAADPEVFYALLTLTRPRTIYRLNLTNGKAEVFHTVEKDFRPEDFVTKHVFYKSKDGTRVPMFIVHKKGITLNGSNPLFMYGYGAFAWNSFLWYQPNVLLWLERGGIYALPRIRGGGEYGESWHQAGIKRNKQNTIDDYISAAEWLIQNQYTSANKLVANGGSASGFLAAIAVMKRPELFGAALIDIPFLDLLRYDKFTGGRSFIPEFGSTENAEEFQFLHSISPYHNIKQGRCYPPMLVRVGELDQTAVPMHGYKFIAALQAAQKDCANPILLKVMRGAGHNFGATPEQNIDSSTEALAFLLRTLN